jgi:hypothetical protein
VNHGAIGGETMDIDIFPLIINLTTGKISDLGRIMSNTMKKYDDIHFDFGSDDFSCNRFIRGTISADITLKFTLRGEYTNDRFQLT